MNDSAQSGVPIPGFQPLAGLNESYKMDSPGLELGRRFLTEVLRVDSALFATTSSVDCYYPNNYCHAELRGTPKSLFMRPTFSSKHILKSSLSARAPDGSGSSVFSSETMRYAYHGTPMRNIKSILSDGLRPSQDGTMGPGLYFSPSPLYAQLYSSGCFHEAAPPRCTMDGVEYFVDTSLLIRYPTDVAVFNSGVDEIGATFGADYCLHKLFKTAKTVPPIEEQLIGQIPPEHAAKVVVQGVIVKLHRHDPYDSSNEESEWIHIRRLVADLPE